MDTSSKLILAIGVTIATGGAAWLAAPAIASFLGGAGLLGAASTGTAILSLEGAALTSASLASIGGGAIAAGGGGIAAGIATITTTGAVVGGAGTLVATSATPKVFGSRGTIKRFVLYCLAHQSGRIAYS